jgi:hypothetical protein
MKLDDAIEFLVAKCELIAELADAESVREHARQMRLALDAACRDPRLSMAALRSIDREGLERALDGPGAATVAQAIRSRLVKRFGVSRLGPTDRAVMRRVLTRGEVANSEEYYQLKDLVEMGPEEAGLTAEKFEELEIIVESFVDPGEAPAEAEPIPAETAGRKSRRVPPPAFDLTLEADEVLCPPETSTEKRVEFLRAKYAKVMACPMRPECRALLANHLEGGLQFARQESAVWERPGERLEHCEHEAEYFAGYEVSGPQHRAIERELEVEFGFRRLGPSAQARLARMLATGDAGTKWNRDFIERFIRQYPHQTRVAQAADARHGQRQADNPVTPGDGVEVAAALPRCGISREVRRAPRARAGP